MPSSTHPATSPSWTTWAKQPRFGYHISPTPGWVSKSVNLGCPPHPGFYALFDMVGETGLGLGVGGWPQPAGSWGLHTMLDLIHS